VKVSIVSNDISCGKLIELLSKFPKDKPVKVLAAGEADFDRESIQEVGYPLVNYDDEIDGEGKPVFTEEDDTVCIFTKEYTDMLFMNGV